MRLTELLHPLQTFSLTVVSTGVLAGSSAMLASSHVAAFVPQSCGLLSPALFANK